MSKHHHNKYKEGSVIIYYCKNCKLPEHECKCKKISHLHFDDDEEYKYKARRNLFKLAFWILGVTACVGTAITIPNLAVNNAPVQFVTVNKNKKNSSDHSCSNDNS